MKHKWKIQKDFVLTKQSINLNYIGFFLALGDKQWNRGDRKLNLFSLHVGNNIFPIKTLGNEAIRMPIIVHYNALGDLRQSKLDSLGQSSLSQCHGTELSPLYMMPRSGWGAASSTFSAPRSNSQWGWGRESKVEEIWLGLRDRFLESHCKLGRCPS